MDWLEWFGFERDPFWDRPLETVDELDRFLILTPSARESIAKLVGNAKASPSVLIVVGERGGGKTTLTHYAESLAQKASLLPVYVALHLGGTEGVAMPSVELTRDIMASCSIRAMQSLKEAVPDLFGRYKDRLISWARYMGYTFQEPEGFLPDVSTGVGIDDLRKMTLGLIGLLSTNGVRLFLVIDNLDRIGDAFLLQFLRGPFAQTFFQEIPRAGGTVLLAIKPSIATEVGRDRDLGYLNNPISCEKLSPNQAVELLQKRMAAVCTRGKNCQDAVTRDAIIAIHSSKRGIERDMLIEARSLCIAAFEKGVGTVDRPFIEGGFRGLNRSKIYFELIDKPEGKQATDRLLRLNGMLQPDEVEIATNLLIQISEDKNPKIPPRIHGVMLEEKILEIAPHPAQKYTITEPIRKAINEAQGKGWTCPDFLTWLLRPETMELVRPSNPGLKIITNIERCSKVLPAVQRRLVEVQEGGTINSYYAKTLLFEGKKSIQDSRNLLATTFSMDWETSDAKTLYDYLYKGLLGFLISFGKFYMCLFPEPTIRMEKYGMSTFDLVEQVMLAYQRKTGTRLKTLFLVTSMREEHKAFVEGMVFPGEQALDEAVSKLGEIVNEFTEIWVNLFAEYVPKARESPHPTHGIRERVLDLAHALGFEKERQDLATFKVDGMDYYQLGFLESPADTARMEFVIQRENGEGPSQYLICYISYDQYYYVQVKDVSCFARMCVDISRTHEELKLADSLYLLLATAKGFAPGVRVARNSLEWPSNSTVQFVDEKHLGAFIREARLEARSRGGGVEASKLAEIGSSDLADDEGSKPAGDLLDVKFDRKILPGHKATADSVVEDWLGKMKGDVVGELMFFDPSTFVYLDMIPRGCGIRLIVSHMDNDPKCTEYAKKEAEGRPHFVVVKFEHPGPDAGRPRSIHERWLGDDELEIDFGTDLKSDALGKSEHTIRVFSNSKSSQRRKGFDTKWGCDESELQRLFGEGVKRTTIFDFKRL